MGRNGLHGLFFVSGFSALIYELVWQRLLNLVFGVSTLSVSAVLAAFMGGMALGGLLFGRLADRTRNPLRLYAWLEAGIGVSGLLVPPCFALLTRTYTSLHAWLEPGPAGGTCLRLGMAWLVLAVPATLLGATVPVMGRLAAGESKGLAVSFSRWYAVNTLGGVLGAALTGFVLLRFLGMQPALWIAAGLNGLVALGAAWAGRKPVALPDTTAPDPGPLPIVRPWLALLCAGLTGVTTLGLEVTWSRILGILTSNSAYGFALLLTVFLLGLGLGSWVQALWCRRPGESWRRLALCQWLLAGVTVATLPWFRHAPAWFDRWCDGTSTGRVFLGELALTAGALLLPAIFLGMSLPLLAAALTNDPRRFGHWVGRLYAVNTLGGVIGPFLTGFLLIPRLGLQPTVGVLIGASLVVGVIAWTRGLAGFRGMPATVAAALVPVVILVAAVGLWRWLPPGVYQKAVVTEPRRLLFYQEGNNATVSVVEEADGVRSLLVDSQPVAGTEGTSVVDQKMLAHLPLLLHPEPHRALTVGFGSGGTSHSMTLHGIAVDCVEIEARVAAAAAWFGSENHDVLTHPRFRLRLDDARSYLRVTPLRYDVIVTDCTNIQYRSNGDLYTVDYFRLMKERLTDNGVAAAWVPANGIRDADLRTLLRSFRTVFPHTSVWFMNTLPTDFLIVVGTPDVLDIDLEQLGRRMHAPGVAEDLATVGFSDPCRLAYTFVTAEDKLAAYLGDGPLNTDDRPVLSYSTYGASFQLTVPGNLVRLLNHRQDVAGYLRHAADEETLMRHYAASTESMLGHVAHLVGAEAGALAHYVRGAKLLPDDAALRALVGHTFARLTPPADATN